MPIYCALRPTTLLKQFLPLCLLMGALVMAPRISADIELKFVYDPVSGATTASYLGSWSHFLHPHSSPYVPPTSLRKDLFFNKSELYGYSGYHSGIKGLEELEGYYPWDVLKPWTGSPSERGGDAFAFTRNLIFAPLFYEEGELLSGYMIFADRNLVDLGFRPEHIDSQGTLYSTDGYNRVHWSTNSGAAVPEPATVGLLLGAAALGFGLWRRRRRSSVG